MQDVATSTIISASLARSRLMDELARGGGYWLDIVVQWGRPVGDKAAAAQWWQTNCSINASTKVRMTHRVQRDKAQHQARARERGGGRDTNRKSASKRERERERFSEREASKAMPCQVIRVCRRRFARLNNNFYRVFHGGRGAWRRTDKLRCKYQKAIRVRVRPTGLPTCITG